MNRLTAKVLVGASFTLPFVQKLRAEKLPLDSSYKDLLLQYSTKVDVPLKSSKDLDIPLKYSSKDLDVQYFTTDQVSQHNSVKTRIWATYNDSVYDITDFIESHPGGDKILACAGGPIDPHWDAFAIHKTEATLELLETLKIGKLADKWKPADKVEFGIEPVRDSRLVVRSVRPFNAEAPLNALESRLTPTNLFFTRNHLPVPEPADSFTVSGNTVNLDLLKQLPKTTIEATLQCAGNRRSEMAAIKPVNGLAWTQGAISNALWGGCRMKDLLAHLQISPSPADNYVCFKGSDGYGASVPLKYLDDILISYQMNSQDIPLDHGPIRVICPGIVAARSVKWVSSIYFSPFESDSHYQQKDYKGFSPSKSASEYDYSKSESINELPVTCAITSPAPGDTINPSGLSVKGYSYAGGGRSIVRVDVSINGGLTWQDAVLDKPQQPAGKTFAWTLWEAKFEIENPKQDLNIVCKAVDQGYNTQPDSFEGIWNARGVLSNAWHRIRLLGKSQS